MTAAQAALVAVRDAIERLQRLEALLADQPAPPEPIATPAVAATLGISAQALAAWARAHGPGASRDGWLLLGRVGSGLRAQWQWAPMGASAQPMA